MPFTRREAPNGVNHILKGWHRVLSGRQASFYVEKLSSELAGSRFKLDELKDIDGKFLTCRVCGYTKVQIELNGGWQMRTCASMLSKSILQSDQFASFEAELNEKAGVKP